MENRSEQKQGMINTCVPLTGKAREVSSYYYFIVIGKFNCRTELYLPRSYPFICVWNYIGNSFTFDIE